MRVCANSWSSFFMSVRISDKLRPFPGAEFMYVETLGLPG
jgi:hypothetical protein